MFRDGRYEVSFGGEPIFDQKTRRHSYSSSITKTRNLPEATMGEIESLTKLIPDSPTVERPVVLGGWMIALNLNEEFFEFDIKLDEHLSGYASPNMKRLVEIIMSSLPIKFDLCNG